MRVMVTGSTGFVGRHVIDALLRAGHAPTRLVRRPVGPRPGVRDVVVPGGLTAVLPAALTGHDALLHLAAAGVSPQPATEAELWATNVTATAALLDIAASAGLERAVVLGSCFEYGAAADRYERVPPDAPLEPLSPYARSKAACFAECSSPARSRELSVIYLRLFSAFGEGQARPALWPSLQAAARAGGDAPLTPGTRVRDFIEVAAAAERVADALTWPVIPGTTTVRNIGTGSGQRVVDFAAEWWERWEARGRLLVGALPDRTDEAARYVADTAATWTITRSAVTQP